MNLVPLEAIYTSNDTFTEVPPAGADGFSSATITVDVPPVVKYTGIGVARGSGYTYSTYLTLSFSTTPTYSADDSSTSQTFPIQAGHALFYVQTGSTSAVIDNVRQVSMNVALNLTDSTQNSYPIRGTYRAWDVELPSSGSGILYSLYVMQGDDPVIYSSTQGGLTTGLTFMTLYTDAGNLDFN